VKNRIGIVVLAVLICVLAVILGRRYYGYTKTDPDFCKLCHPMQEAYRSWTESKHGLIICQECHRLSLVEENRMLLAFVAGRTEGVRQDHGRETPWESCRGCHADDIAQGSVTLRVSYGHARHVFMQNIPCWKCHSGSLHRFSPDQSKCRDCHPDKRVHGMGTVGLYCLNCHSFGAARAKLFSPERCFECHGDVPRSGTMSRLDCHECHHPHEKLRMESADCLGTCHSSEVRVGRHGDHMKKAKLECVDCHRPHTWRIGRKSAPGLCDRCHPLKDPASFIY